MYYRKSYRLKKNRKHLHLFSVSVFFLLLTLIFSCTKERPVQNSEQELTVYKERLPTVSFSERVYKTQQITTKAHYFSSKIAFKEALIYVNKKDNYTFVWIVDAVHTDFKELEKWKLGMILKPKNRSDFKDQDLEKKGIKTMGVLTKTFLLENEVCIILRDFEFKPKELAYIKFYLYNDSEKVNIKYWITENLNLKI